jgi:hypothetical protein
MKSNELDRASQYPKDDRTGLTLPLSRLLGLQDLAKHRAMVAVELEVLAKKLDRFGWERDRSSAAHDRLIVDWMDALQDYPIEEVRAACRAAVLESPSRFPNEGHVLAQIKAARAKHLAMNPPPPLPEPSREPMTPERAAQIMAEGGFRPRTFGSENNA